MYDGGKFGPPTIQKFVKFRDFVVHLNLVSFLILRRSFQKYQWILLTGLYQNLEKTKPWQGLFKTMNLAN